MYIHVHQDILYMHINYLLLSSSQIMAETSKKPLVYEACHAENRLQDLETLSVGLEKCQKSLNDYLDSKRNAFPRFFFISDEELLSILGSHECTCVQEHMIKVDSLSLSFSFSLSLSLCLSLYRFVSSLTFSLSSPSSSRCLITLPR